VLGAWSEEHCLTPCSVLPAPCDSRGGICLDAHTRIRTLSVLTNAEPRFNRGFGHARLAMRMRGEKSRGKAAAVSKRRMSVLGRATIAVLHAVWPHVAAIGRHECGAFHHLATGIAGVGATGAAGAHGAGASTALGAHAARAARAPAHRTIVHAAGIAAAAASGWAAAVAAWRVAHRAAANAPVGRAPGNAERESDQNCQQQSRGHIAPP
jgi:hypothetical protein